MIEAYKKLEILILRLLLEVVRNGNYVKYQSKHIGNDVKHVGPIPQLKDGFIMFYQML